MADKINEQVPLTDVPAFCSSSIGFTIKYEGLALGEHEIDLASLGESLQGFAKILATAGYFVASGHYVRQYSAQNVKVTTNAGLNPGSIEIIATIKALFQSSLFSGSVGAVLGALTQYLLSRKDKKEMEHLAEALKQSLEQNKELAENSQEMVGRLLDTIDKMADGLSNAQRQALSPIGKSCKTISVLDGKGKLVTADKNLKDYFEKDQQIEITEPQKFEGVLVELDKENGNCKLRTESGERFLGTITDPSLHIPGNVYIKSFFDDRPIVATAKAQLNKDGEVTKLFISDAVVKKEEG